MDGRGTPPPVSLWSDEEVPVGKPYVRGLPSEGNHLRLPCKGTYKKETENKYKSINVTWDETPTRAVVDTRSLGGKHGPP